jgi:hypothetical protein
MMKFLQKLLTIKGLVISNLVMLITMKRNISITIIIIKMSTSKIHKKEATKIMRWFLKTEDLLMSILKLLWDKINYYVEPEQLNQDSEQDHWKR